jgi:hypothetical protein
MNGDLDKQTSGNDWGSNRSTMLHERLQHAISAIPAPKAQQFVIDDLERQMADHDDEFREMLGVLRHTFVFTNQLQVESFLRSNRALPAILVEAAPHFSAVFPDVPLALDIMTEEGAPRTIYALALWRGDRTKAKQALKGFDEKWWLDNARKAAGKIVFDYELLK